MDTQSLGKVLGEMAVRSKGMTILDFTRAIQRAEGNFDCFGTAADGVCDQDRCLWREDCFILSAAGKKKS